ncbi:hypothetical protein CLV47_1014 [Antricoccus suffuscus]|uniref:DUF2255 family protein n=1 Tax=Antricoccus suffuscus TaxID=1629062 RepID=A0A2T1A5L7_9ACTN|nr:DUF2255 family protein [Antricoccus suffuscus]PRZ43880.1 hypothetical protein CLV47_1014 [Antricoccus suffuscus]
MPEGNRWTAAELAAVDDTEIKIASRRRDGTLRPARIVWVVRHDDALYVRSVNGPDATWYRGVQARHQGMISASGLQRDVSFVEADHTPDNALDDTLDAAYRIKYGQWPGPTERITSTEARRTTLRLDPA